MKNYFSLYFLSLLILLPLLFHGGFSACMLEPKKEANMFWWLYKSPYRVEDPSKPWPIILWRGSDNPVVTGYSFVEDKTALVRIDEAAATDLTTLSKELFNKDENLQKSSLFIASESYGGRYDLDLVCATKGVEAWLRKLKWEGLQNFMSLERTPLYCEDDFKVQGFTASYSKLTFYWILGAGHFVPSDQPCLALKMIGDITQSPA